MMKVPHLHWNLGLGTSQETTVSVSLGLSHLETGQGLEEWHPRWLRLVAGELMPVIGGWEELSPSPLGSFLVLFELFWL